MIWCVPADNQSSTWNTSDTCFVVCPQASVQHVRDEVALPEDLLQIVLPASRCVSSGHEDFSVSNRSLFLCSDPVFPAATRTSPSFMCALRKAVFTSAVNIV